MGFLARVNFLSRNANSTLDNEAADGMVGITYALYDSGIVIAGEPKNVSWLIPIGL